MMQFYKWPLKCPAISQAGIIGEYSLFFGCSSQFSSFNALMPVLAKAMITSAVVGTSQNDPSGFWLLTNQETALVRFQMAFPSCKAYSRK